MEVGTSVAFLNNASLTYLFLIPLHIGASTQVFHRHLHLWHFSIPALHLQENESQADYHTAEAGLYSCRQELLVRTKSGSLHYSSNCPGNFLHVNGMVTFLVAMVICATIVLSSKFFKIVEDRYMQANQILSALSPDSHDLSKVLPPMQIQIACVGFLFFQWRPFLKNHALR